MVSPVIEEGHVNLAARSIQGLSCATTRVFVSHFGAPADVIARLWNLCRQHFTEHTRPFHLLWALLFIKTYQTEDILSRQVGCKCRRTYRKYVWRVLEAIQETTLDYVGVLALYNTLICFMAQLFFYWFVAIPCTD